MKAENVTPILLADSLDSIEKVPSPRPAEVTPEVGPIVSESALKPNYLQDDQRWVNFTGLD